MLYTRNKDCFKKTIKVDHIEAKKNIINLIKDVVGKDASISQRSRIAQARCLSQNQCKNIQKQESQSKLTINNFLKQQKPEMLCQSIYSQQNRHNKSKQRILTIQHVIDYSIKSIDSNISKSTKAQKQYVELLQIKIQQLQNQIIKQKQQIKKIEEYNKTNKIQIQNTLQTQTLLRFYHRARNILVLQSVQLLQCKNIICCDPKINQNRIKSINSMIAKSQQLLQVYKRSAQKGSPRKPNTDLQQMNVQQLRDLCNYQQKTIDFLRKQKQNSNQFNQIRLLRHQINRVCNQNQTLLSKLSKLSAIQPKKQPNNQISPQVIKQLQNRQIKITKLQSQLQKLIIKLKQQQDKTYKFKQQKQYLLQFLDQATNKTKQLEKQVESYQKEISHMKLKSINKINFQNKDIATTQQLCRQLKAYPRYFNLLMSIINQYQNKISQLQDKICAERQQKQKFMQWSRQVYHLLEQAQLPTQVLQKHMNELYKMDNKMDCSKIQKILRQIRALSIGIHDKQIKQMQAELQEYIISLKCKNQVIKEVDCQDGSSVAVSDTFTDQQQFDQVQIQRKWEMHHQ